MRVGLTPLFCNVQPLLRTGRLGVGLAFDISLVFCVLEGGRKGRRGKERRGEERTAADGEGVN